MDASPVGLGALLAQVDAKGQTIVAYASRSLTPTEQRYSQTEREALAITWACLHFHLYVFGSRFTVLTDHKPLVPIFNKRTSTPPARIEKWLMRLQMYDMTIQYRPGSDNPADYMSRHPSTTSGTSSKEESMAEEFVNMIITDSIPKSVSLAEIAAATKTDEALRLAIQAGHTTGHTTKWHTIQRNASPEVANRLNHLSRICSELTVAETEHGHVLLRAHRIVIPQGLTDRIVGIAHEGHQGIAKTKSLLREKVWWPGIDQDTHRATMHPLPSLSRWHQNRATPHVRTAGCSMAASQCRFWWHAIWHILIGCKWWLLKVPRSGVSDVNVSTHNHPHIG